ncbi:FAD-dependent oxidoreductase [Dactylosporangium sp. CA-139114]|uniref:FAD-dependent oxidoreductase n=1 Tax=Dactylosporangium sp. CA-139114 TaxID=3239931 RepID=UPI003D995ACD
MRVAVIGAGPAGATAAYCLARAGVEVDVYEASGGVGGMARSIDLWGQTVGIGPQHFSSSDPRVNELWLEAAGGAYEMVEPRVRTYRDGRLHRDPRPLADRFLRRPAPAFAHPRQGPGEVYARMCAFAERHGGRVHLDAPVAGLALDGTRVTGVRLNTGEIREHDHVISSMPPPGARPAYRHTVVVYLHTTAESVFGDTWIDVPDPGLRTERVTNFDNWVPAAKRGERETVLALEYRCGDDDCWRWDDERYVALARTEIAAIGLVAAEEILDAVALRVPKSRATHHGPVAPIEGLQVLGRPGATQALSILSGLLAAENVLEDAGHDLRSPTPHPGRSRITATGLEMESALRPRLKFA